MRNLKILGYNYEVRYSPPIEVGGMEQAARCCTGKGVILINSVQSKQMQESSMLHEIIEALNYHLELGLGHQTVMSLESGLYQALRDNGVSVGALLKK